MVQICVGGVPETGPLLPRWAHGGCCLEWGPEASNHTLCALLGKGGLGVPGTGPPPPSPAFTPTDTSAPLG